MPPRAQQAEEVSTRPGSPPSAASLMRATAPLINAALSTAAPSALAPTRPRNAQPASSSMSTPSSYLPLSAHKPHTPIIISALKIELESHPDDQLVASLLHDLEFGFRIGFGNCLSESFLSRNLSSAADNAEVVDDYLRQECERGHTAGPFEEPPVLPIHTSGIGVEPKKSGGVRLIMHLSAPAGRSINDGIKNSDFSFQMISVDTVADHVMRTGKGALLCKVDIKHAFRLCPVHPNDWPLLGICWRGKFYVDKVLPFGLRSAPVLFNRLAEALAWLLRHNKGLKCLEHYLDDFINVSPPAPVVATSTAAVHMATILEVFANLGVPIAEGADKVVGPATVMTVLGIELDTQALEMRLPADKLFEIKARLNEWAVSPSCTKHQLLSLIGLLSFASKVVAAGRTFTRRLIHTSTTVTGLDEEVHLDADAQADIRWWKEFLPHWNGRALLRDPVWSKPPDFELYTDASGLGFGGFFQSAWFCQEWGPEHQHGPVSSIMWREMYPIAVAAQLWGPQWQTKKILLHCDNQAVATAWESGSCRNLEVMNLIRTTLRIAARYNFILLIRHISGIDNSIADALSRLQLSRFRSLAPSANPDPVPLPTQIV